MNWESNSHQEACPCGNGTYTVTNHSNDWGQSNTTWLMNCPSCKRRYFLHTFICYPNGLYSEGHRWVLKPAYKDAKKLQREAKKTMDQALTLAKKRYLKLLIAHFAGVPKKQIWATLHGAIPYYKSLGTFYSHTKGKSEASYFAEIFSEYKMKAVWKILDIQDDEINHLQDTAESLSNKAENLLRGA